MPNLLSPNNSWQALLSAESSRPYFKKLSQFVNQQYDTPKIIYPLKENVYRALELTSLDQVKVIIIGQDPYHGQVDGMPQAQGLSFSVPAKIKNPPSLQNIFKELATELGRKPLAESKHHGDLTCWAKQGVLLLNAVLTVERSKPGSHRQKGWEQFTDSVISTVSNNTDNVVFILWGAYARGKKGLIDSTRHLVLESPHPSPLSAYRGFFGNNHFIAANKYLVKNSKTPINW